MSQRDPRLIGGVYRVGQVVTVSGILTQYTAHNNNTNGVVGLVVIELPPTVDVQRARQLLQAVERRRLVKSPSLLSIHDLGIDGRRAYIATDPPRGLTLRQVLENETIDLRRALGLAQQIGRGLAALHEQGIAGMDLRPHLITVEREASSDHVQLDDVGLRPLLGGLDYIPSQRTDDIGYLDPRYAPPECLQGGPVGPWSDVYQWGLLVFELVTGRVPYVGHTNAETVDLQCTGPVPRMMLYKQDVPGWVQGIVDRALAKNTAGRFAQAADLLAALEVFLPAVGDGDEPTIRANPDTNRAANKTPGDRTEERVYARLYYEQEGKTAQEFAMEEPNIIVGRHDPRRGLHPDIDLTALDPKMTVSRLHARISYEGTLFYVEDLKSHNGTRIGELTLTPKQKQLLQHGDVVQFGSVRLVFKVPEESG